MRVIGRERTMTQEEPGAIRTSAETRWERRVLGNDCETRSKPLHQKQPGKKIIAPQTIFWPANIKDVIDDKEIEREINEFLEHPEFWNVEGLVYFNDKNEEKVNYKIGTGTSLS